MRAIHDTEFPNSVDATQKLVDEQGAEYERLKVSNLATAIKEKWTRLMACGDRAQNLLTDARDKCCVRLVTSTFILSNR